MSQRHEDFHAHIYFSPEQEERARDLRVRSVASFETGLWVGPLHPGPLGPHTTGMFEIQFSRTIFQPLVDWLAVHRGEHSVLVHEVTGDDPRDHLEGARWLGPPVALDLTKLDPSPVQAEAQLTS